MVLVGIEQTNCQKETFIGHFLFLLYRKHLVGTQQSYFQENTQALAFSPPFRMHAVNFGVFFQNGNLFCTSRK